MKLLIDIPEEYYEVIKKIPIETYTADMLIIANGKPLDKSFEWCTDCKEYDHNRHCCPRWTKVIRTTLNDSINAVLDDIRAEFKKKAKSNDWYHTTDGLLWEEAIEIIDKHRAGGKDKG